MNDMFLSGRFGFFQMRLRMRAYNLDRKATILRQCATEKDALRATGLRPPIGNRIDRAASAMTWGNLNIDKPGGEFVTLRDCTPFAGDAYEPSTSDGGEI